MEASENMCCDDASAPAVETLTDAAESEAMCSQDAVAPMESAAVPTAEALGRTEPIVEVGNEVALIQHMLGLGPGTSASIMGPEISGSQVKEVVFASHPVADAEIDISSSESESEEEEVDKKGGGRVESVMEEEDAGFVNPKEVKTKHELHYSVRCLQHQAHP
jgi:hypothetical protein